MAIGALYQQQDDSSSASLHRLNELVVTTISPLLSVTALEEGTRRQNLRAALACISDIAQATQHHLQPQLSTLIPLLLARFQPVEMMLDENDELKLALYSALGDVAIGCLKRNDPNYPATLSIFKTAEGSIGDCDDELAEVVSTTLEIMQLN
jgi:hypothetical protein